MQIEVGTQIDERYEVVRLLGEGGLAQVFLVKHLELGGLQAVKFLSVADDEQRERLLREGRIQAQVRHPNLVLVHDVIRQDSEVGLLMEYVDGPSLLAYLNEQGPLPIDEALSLFEGIVRGVAAAHRHNILHRDLKPANVLLAWSPDGPVPKVADFGIAKLLDDASPHTLVGTPGYVSPEQILDPELVGYPADVFALGAILYEMLVGVRAFENTQGRVAVFSTAHRRPKPLAEERPDVPPRIVSIVDRALDPDPAERFTDAAELGKVLFGHDTNPVMAPPPTPTAMDTNTRPTLAGGVAVAAGVTVIGAGVVAVASFLLVAGIGLGAWWLFATNEPVETAAVAPAPVAAPVSVATRAEDEGDVEDPSASPGSSDDPGSTDDPDDPDDPVRFDTPDRAPTPVPSDASDRTPVPAPDPVFAPDPAGTPDEADVAPVDPAPAAPAPPPPEAPAPVAALDLSGTWVGQANGTPFELRLSGSDASLRGEAVFVSGRGDRAVQISGSADPATGNVALSGSGLTFQGTVGPGGLSGTYSRGSKQLDWTVERPR